MTALAADIDRYAAQPHTLRRMLLKAAMKPFSGSLLSYDAGGFVQPLVAGAPFAGVNKRLVNSIDAPVADGDIAVDVFAGIFLILATMTSPAQADVAYGKRVYASDDATLTFTEAGNTFIGTVVGYQATTGKSIILCRTTDQIDPGVGTQGSTLLADAAATLTMAHLDKVLVMPNSVARTLTLPPAASCAGRTVTVVKSTAAAAAVTLQGNASENINGANTKATSTSQWAMLQVRCDGTQWIVVGVI